MEWMPCLRQASRTLQDPLIAASLTLVQANGLRPLLYQVHPENSFLYRKDLPTLVTNAFYAHVSMPL